MSRSIGHRSQALTDRGSIHDPIAKAGMATARTSRAALAAPMMDLALASSKVMSHLGQWWCKKSSILPLRDSAGISFALAWNQRASKTAPTRWRLWHYCMVVRLSRECQCPCTSWTLCDLYPVVLSLCPA